MNSGLFCAAQLPAQCLSGMLALVLDRRTAEERNASLRKAAQVVNDLVLSAPVDLDDDAAAYLYDSRLRSGRSWPSTTAPREVAMAALRSEDPDVLRWLRIDPTTRAFAREAMQIWGFSERELPRVMRDTVQYDGPLAGDLVHPWAIEETHQYAGRECPIASLGEHLRVTFGFIEPDWSWNSPLVGADYKSLGELLEKDSEAEDYLRIDPVLSETLYLFLKDRPRAQSIIAEASPGVLALVGRVYKEVARPALSQPAGPGMSIG